MSDPRKRSRVILDGPSRSGARSMLHAIGFTESDLKKPLVGIATTWTETMPCNYNHRHLAEKVKEGVRAAGRTPMEFNTVSVSDGVSMGTEAMKASLVSREVIADSIELLGYGCGARHSSATRQGWSERNERCEFREILLAVQRVRDPPSEGIARPAGSEPCAASGNARGDA
jgi:hypothetical protein